MSNVHELLGVYLWLIIREREREREGKPSHEREKDFISEWTFSVKKLFECSSFHCFFGVLLIKVNGFPCAYFCLQGVW